MSSNANSHAQQHFHNHNASMGRIPAGAMPSRHSRELSTDNSNIREQVSGYPSIHSALQASAAPFGPSMTTSSAGFGNSTATAPVGGNGINSFNSFYPANGFHNGAPNGGPPFGGPAMLANNMQQLNLNGMGGNNMYGAQNFNNGYGGMPFHQNNQPRDSQARVIQNRRQVDNEGT